MFIGVRDDGSCAGLPITDELLRNPGGHRDNGNIQPIPSVVIQKRSVAGCEIVAILVHPSDALSGPLSRPCSIRVGPPLSLQLLRKNGMEHAGALAILPPDLSLFGKPLSMISI